jgi:hypothetical protein
MTKPVLHFTLDWAVQMSCLYRTRWVIGLAVLLFPSFMWGSEPSSNNSGLPSAGDQRDVLNGNSPELEKPDGISGVASEHNAAGSKTKKPVDQQKPSLIVDKQTTYLLKPLRADGYPDYFAALNDYCRGHAKSSDNAAVPLIQAFGPESISPVIREEYFKLLGIAPLQPVGNYFVRSQEMLDRWSKGTPQLPIADQADELQEQFAVAGEHPWTAEEYPMVAEWLSINDGPLQLIAEASRRPHFYEPMVSPSHNLPALYSVVSPLEQSLGEVTLALQARAMLQTKSGKVQAAWNDLLTCHRCLRLMSSMPLGQYAVETRTAENGLRQTELKILHYCHPELKQIEEMRADLAALPPLSNLGDRINIGDRFRFLDAVCELDRHGPAALQQLFGATSLTAEESALQKAASDLLFDWNEPLRMGNNWFDKEVAIYRMSDHKKRDESLEQLHADLDKMTTDVSNPGTFALTWFAKRSVKAALGRVVGASLLQLFDNEVPGILNIADQLELHTAFSQAGIALAAYRAAHGEYPERIDQLVPEYISQVPCDMYGEHAELHYRRESSGYLLYSVGPNGRDEQGGASDNFPDSDDISLIISDAPVTALSK